MKTLLQILFFFLLVTQLCFAQWVQTNGPYGGPVTALAASGSNLFAGIGGLSIGGVYCSTNNGASWTEITEGLTAKRINTFGVYHSDTGDTIIFAGNYGGIFYSTNNGNNWIEVSSGLPENKWVTSFAFNDDILFTGLYYGGVYLSIDDSISWAEAGLSEKNVNALIVTPDGVNLFAGTQGSIFRSTDNGTSWSEVNSGLPDVGTVYHFAIIPDGLGGLNLFAGTWGGVFLSTNNGTSWTKAGLTGTPTNALVVSDTNLFAGSWSGGVYLSSDNGSRWTDVSTGLTDNNVHSLIIKDSYLYAGTDNGVWRRPLAEMITAVESSYELPLNFNLEQNYPNPFNPTTTIKYSIPSVISTEGRNLKVTLKVFDVLGKEVATLVNEEKQVGTYELTWNAANLPSGVYFFRLQAGSYVQTRKMILLK